jgi:ADP-heptose:LPS heptosyltransferase
VILVLRALGIGDLATAVPALRGLRAAFPGHPLVLAAPGWLAPLVDLVGGVDRLVPTDGLTGRDWSLDQPYWAVNLHGRGPSSHRLLQAAEPVLLRAHHCPAAGHTDGPPWRDDEHEVHRWCRLLDFYGVPTDPGDLDLLRPPQPTGPPAGVTVVHPGGKDPARRWSPARFAAVAAALHARGHRVVVTGSPAESGLATAVARRAGLDPSAVLAGRLDLAGLAGLVAGARLVVSADTGVAHLATGYRTPSVVLFGPVRPDRWGPPPDRPWHRVLWAGPQARPVAAGPTPDGPPTLDARLAAISVAQVLQATDQAGRAGDRRGWLSR